MNGNEKMRFFKKTIVVLGVFVLFQDLLLQHLRGTKMERFVQNIDELVALFLFLNIFARRLAFSGDKRVTARCFFVPLLVACGCLPCLLNSTNIQVMAEGCFMVVKGFMFYYVVSSVCFTEEEIKKIIILFFVLGVIFLIGMVFDAVFPQTFRALIGNHVYISSRLGIRCPVSFFSSLERSGWWMAYLVLFLCAAFIVYRKKTYLFAMSPFAICAVLTMRAKPVFGALLAVTIGYLAIPNTKTKKRWLFVALAIFLFAGVFGSGQLLALYEHKQKEFFSGRETPRSRLYNVAFDIAKKRFPLGVGFGRYGGYISAKYYSDVYHKYGFDESWGFSKEHPDFLEDAFWPMILGETGYLGTLSYVGILLSFFVMIRKKMKRYPDPATNFLCIAGIMILVEGIMESTAAPFFAKMPFNYFVFGLLGIINSRFLYKNSGSAMNKHTNHTIPQ